VADLPYILYPTYSYPPLRLHLWKQATQGPKKLIYMYALFSSVFFNQKVYHYAHEKLTTQGKNNLTRIRAKQPGKGYLHYYHIFSISPDYPLSNLNLLSLDMYSAHLPDTKTMRQIVGLVYFITP